jgi:hypothetical protein
MEPETGVAKVEGEKESSVGSSAELDDLPLCERCGGSGIVSGYGHDCGGNEARCARVCPVEVPEPCPDCGGRVTVVV